MQPIIGLSSFYGKAHELNSTRARGRRDQDIMLVSMDYPEAVSRAGGTPLAIAPIDCDDYLQSVIASIDGLVLTGGADINPQHYNQSVQKGLGKIEVERDIIELKLLKYAFAKQMPIFGICRGLQLLNVYLKGTLVQDIRKDTDKVIEHAFSSAPKATPVHRVEFVQDSPLKRKYGDNSIWVNSLHHQVIDRLGEGLSVTGRSEDGYIEAIQYDANPAVFGVQWHPEMMAAVYSEHGRAFDLLIEYAAAYKNGQK